MPPHPAFNSLELQLQAKGHIKVVAECMADEIADRRSYLIDMFGFKIRSKILKEGHALVASGALTECKP